MKKLIIWILLSVFFLNASAQVLIMQKPWETSLSVFYGQNYSSGYDLSATLNLRFKESSWGVYVDFTRSDEKVIISGEDNNFSINGLYPSLGVSFSFREKLSPAPFDIFFNGGFAHGSATLKLADGQFVKENSFGNHLGVSVKYLFTPRFALCLRQTLHILYESPFGNTRTTSSAGLSFTF